MDEAKKSIREYSYSDDTGDAKAVVYHLFPGVEVAYISVHMADFDFGLFEQGERKNYVSIHYCAEGRIEQQVNDEFFYLMPGDCSFAIDLLVMSVAATFVYSYMFKKTGNNVLYVLLIGTVLSSFFGSIQSTMIRVMDPNEYDTLLTTLVADFNNVNVEVIVFSLLLLTGLTVFLWKDLMLLDVITLGKDQAINLGVDYDRTVRRLLLGVVLCIAVTTAMVGPISFLGLIIANLARQFLKTYRHAELIAGSALMGMLAIITGQLISQHMFSYAVPISTFITIGGGIYFLYLLLFKKGGI